jgi:Tfp pilus assembly protein FimT
VRYAIITEKLNRRLVCLTGIVAIATVLLVAVPFITPSLESQRLESSIANTQAALQAEKGALKREVQELKQALSVLNNQVQNITLRSSGTAQKRAAP